MSIFLANIDMNEKPVDDIDIYGKCVDFLSFYRHIYRNIGLN